MGKHVSFRRSQVAGPPTGEPWVWHSVTLLRSMAWRERSIALVRLLEFLEIEHLAHGGMENGNLVAPYADLVRFGIHRENIAGTIKEGERLRLLMVERGGQDLDTGKRLPSRYLLTYLPTRRIIEGAVEWLAPRDDWRKYRSSEPAAKKQKPSTENRTD